MIIKLSYLLLVGGVVAFVNSFTLDNDREKRNADHSMPEDCSKLPGKKNMKCCPLPKERIFGNLKPSFQTCFKNFESEFKEKEMPGKVETTSMQPTGDNGNKRKHLSEKVKDIFKKAYKIAKTMINVLKDNIVMIPDQFQGLRQEECFMECVFENSGFLSDKKVNKDSLLERLKQNLKDDNQWLQIATSAVEKCHLTLSNIRTNSTCTSGAAPIFHCIHKYIFLNCPTWLQNDEYCSKLKDFYKKCPDGPPPPVDEKLLEEFSENSPDSTRM